MFPTLEQLLSMDTQDVFDHVARHLLRQGRRCIGPEGYCRYRGIYDPSACAVGALIPDSLYEHWLEDNSLRGLIVDLQVHGNGQHRMLAGFLGQHYPLLLALQALHDNATDCTTEWPRGLRGIAHALGLSARVVDGEARAEPAQPAGGGEIAFELFLVRIRMQAETCLSAYIVPSVPLASNDAVFHVLA